MTHRPSIITTPTARRSTAHGIRVAGSVLLTGVLGACDRPTASAPTPDAPAPVRQVVALGSPDHPDARITITADRPQLTVADRLRLSIALEASPDFSIQWITPPPQPPNGRIGDFTVAAHTAPESPRSSGAGVHTFILEPFLDGQKSIPPLSFRITPIDPARQGAPAPRELTTQPMTFNVSPLLSGESAERAELAAPMPPVPLPVAEPLPAAAPRRLLIAVGAAVVAALGLLIGWAWRRRPRAEDPAEVARNALASLRSTLESAAADPYGPAAARAGEAASRIGAIVRAFLERGLSVAAIGATVTELRPRLAAALPPEDREPIERALADLEREAFAPTQPRVAVLLEHLGTAERFVQAAAARAVLRREGRA